MKYNRKINLSLLRLIPIFLLLFLVSSCETITGIFKAGMGLGMFIVIAVIAVIIVIILKLGKK